MHSGNIAWLEAFENPHWALLLFCSAYRLEALPSDSVIRYIHSFQGTRLLCVNPKPPTYRGYPLIRGLIVHDCMHSGAQVNSIFGYVAMQ